jgi:hypothetical protein
MVIIAVGILVADAAIRAVNNHFAALVDRNLTRSRLSLCLSSVCRSNAAIARTPHGPSATVRNNMLILAHNLDPLLPIASNDCVQI